MGHPCYAPVAAHMNSLLVGQTCSLSLFPPLLLRREWGPDRVSWVGHATPSVSACLPVHRGRLPNVPLRRNVLPWLLLFCLLKHWGADPTAVSLPLRWGWFTVIVDNISQVLSIPGSRVLGSKRWSLRSWGAPGCPWVWYS